MNTTSLLAYEKTLSIPLVIHEHLSLLLDVISQNQGHPILVGGAVRDHLLGIQSVDFDVEVYHLSVDELEHILSKHFSVYAVGKTFGIFKVVVSIKGVEKSFDVATPRLENKTGFGHRGFVITPNPHMSFKEAALRRDFTINAMGINPAHQTLLDPFDGERDLKQKILRHVSSHFSEDPLRVLRAAQFCARFGLTLHEDTIKLCQTLKLELLTLSKERIYEEMKKLILAAQPSLGLEILRQTEALILFPELEDLIECEQDPEWHPEGDVWIHTLMVTDQAAKIAAHLSEEERLIVMAGALCHDLGKPKTTIHKDGRVKSPGHEQAGIAPTLGLLEKMGFPKKWHDEISCLVAEHLKPFQLYKTRDEVSDGAIRRLATRVNINYLLLVSRADYLGRTSQEAILGLDPSDGWLRAKLKEVMGAATKPTPIIMGRHLIALGLTPNKEFSALLSQAFEAQLDGVFSNEEQGINWIKNLISQPGSSK